MKKKQENFITLFFILLAAIFTWLVSKNSFFWDTIQLGSKQAHWFYDNNFRFLLLPNEIDSGHPPVFGMYLAMLWKIFGKTLPISHWAMFPFIVGIILQSKNLLLKFVEPVYLLPAMFLFLGDATLLGQASLVSPDILLVFFFLLSINSILSVKKSLLFISVIGLSLISMRGMMGVLAIFLFALFINYYKNNFRIYCKDNVKLVFFFILYSLPVILFLFWHYHKTGWIGYHAASNWATSFETAGVNDFLKNFLIICWRLLDFGRIFIWAFLVISFYYLLRKKIRPDQNLKILIGLMIITFFVFTSTALIYKNLFMHRYLLPCILVTSLLSIYILFNLKITRVSKSIIFLIIFVGLLSGNFWKYPEGIATGWDATLGHLPWYKLRNEMMTYMKENNIPIDHTGSAFPNISKLKFTDLSEDESKFLEKDLSSQQYIFYSNIFNEFSNEEIKELADKWKILKRYKKFGIKVALYENPKMLKL